MLVDGWVRWRRVSFVRAACIWGLVVTFAVARPQAPDSIRETLRGKVEPAGDRSRILVGDDVVYAVRALSTFYEDRGFAPAWFEGRRPGPAARQLISVIEHIDEEGLRPSDYHLDDLRARIAQPNPDDVAVAESDLLLTDAFLILGAHLVSGRVDPASFDPEWIAIRREVNLVELLEQALSSGEVRATLLGLRPDNRGYARLLDALARYRTIETSGGWPRLPEGPSLRPGDREAGVVVLRRRLQATGDLGAATSSDPSLFGEELTQAVKTYQRRNGLADDGVVGAKTRESLNASVARRVRQIELNLERWRWLPQELGTRYILVNIPEFRLHVIEDDRNILTLNVIVGRTYRQTPVFSDIMRYLVFSPAWEVPPTILRKDKLPEIRKDPDYVRRQRMRVYERGEHGWHEVEPGTVDWSAATSATIRLRQDPGPDNALGRVKFMFPNPYDVYLHDTPSRELFSRHVRDFSSGCIRVEHPLELALYLLAGDPRWTRASVEAAMQRETEQTVMLAEPIPVHLQYWTAWTDPDGTVEFRRDLYGRDAKLDAALRLPPPAEPEESTDDP